MTENFQNIVKLLDQKRLEQASIESKILLKQFPEDIDLLNIYGNILNEKKLYNQAIEIFKKIIAQDDTIFEAYNNCGLSYLHLKNYDLALSFFNKAIEINPEYWDCYNNKGRLLLFSGHLEEAIKLLNIVIKVKPSHEYARYNLALSYQKNNEIDSAIGHYKQLIIINPNFSLAYNNCATAFLEKGDKKNAIKYTKLGLSKNPKFIECHFNLSKLINYTNEDDFYFLKIKQILEQEPLSDYDLMLCHLILAKAYEDMNDYEQSFNHLYEGNKIRKKLIGYDIKTDINNFSYLKKIFSNDNVYHLSKNINYRKRLIFIVGMPRSGTTLLEQMLSNHSQVYGAGEKEYITQGLEEIKNKYEDSDNYSQNKVRFLRNFYLSKINGSNINENYIIDKLPLNYVWIGFIIAAFPNAKIIHIKRDSIATCWSNYKNYFVAEGNGFSYDLEDVANYYLMYEDLMAFWNKQYPQKIYNVDYEKIIDNPESELKNLLGYCELDYESDCLEFYNNKKNVNTISALQVRKPIYKNSNDAWKKYKQYLLPILKILENSK